MAPYADVPRYDRSRLQPHIIHLGVGGFHRAHQAMFTDQLLRRGVGDWGICGAGLLNEDRGTAAALMEQDHLYTLVEQSRTQYTVRVIGSIIDYILAVDDVEPLIERMASEQTRIVSLTITEDGYHYDNGSHHLDLTDRAVMHDIAHPKTPCTAAGLLSVALDRRRRRGLTPFTVLSCDNVPENGAVARTVVQETARHIVPEASAWIEDCVPFPLTMVDRITPQTSAEQRRWLSRECCIEDGRAVFSEDFIQWVIEDNFAMGRPEWDRVGAQFVSDVQPFELMKIRLLNGSHSAISYPGLLLGYQTVHEAMGDPDVASFLVAYMNEISPTVPPVPHVDLEAYKAALVERFGNPAVKDQLSRLARYGSRKIPNAILSAATDALQGDRSVRLMGFVIALWIEYYAEATRGKQLRVPDPLGDRLYEAAPRCLQNPTLFLSVDAVFPQQLSRDRRFAEAVRRGLSDIQASGVRMALQRATANANL